MELITGGTGIVGAHVLLELVRTGRPVRALIRSGSDRQVVERIFRHYDADVDALLARIEWVEGDLLDMGSLEDAMRGVNCVYHAAAMVSFDPADATMLRKMNVEGTANVVNAALLCGVERLCHVSSTAAIGRGNGDEVRHEDLPWDPDKNTSDYATTKYEAELEVQRGIAEGLDAVMVNPCVVIGPGAPGRSTMTMIERIQKGTRFYPPGSNAVVDARDVAFAMVHFMQHGKVGERYLLVGENVSYRALFELIGKAFGHAPATFALRPWMLQLGWRLEWLRSRITGTRPLMTRSTAHSAVITRSYDGSKAIALLGRPFRSAEEAVTNVANYLKALSVHQGQGPSGGPVR